MDCFEDCLLLDFYGELLTPKMKHMLELYLNDDLSLSEIADNENISKQGVHDSIKRAKASLHDYESKLGLVRRFVEEHEAIDKAICYLEENQYDEALRELNNLRETIIGE